ncbi:MAG: retron system putative HNH endonuclease [Phascolarctobacterium sp.]|nr:retron system putative HNH endonuclease [Phascolarctobacterium sp.]
MKRVYKSQPEPEALERYRTKYPTESWEHFRRRSHYGYQQVKQQILRDQHGLCAYCEISIKLAEEEPEVDDFRVEHFYPKSATTEHGHNYHLDWNNMLGVCHGGSQPYVPDAKWRYSQHKNDRSCDVPKGSKPISQLILNPLKIPGQKRLFCYTEHSGKMLVDYDSCPKKLWRRAESTIKELNLNAPRLMRMRLAVIQKLEDEIAAETAEGMPLEEVLTMLAETCLVPNYEGTSLPFFSVIRWYLGEAAERVIAASGDKL